MLNLIIVSLIWAFSFGLIKNQLTGLDPILVAFLRLALSFLVFVPFLKMGLLKIRDKVLFIGLGMLQYGLMYVTYIYSYQFLPAYQVALFTIFTPLYVTLVNDLLDGRLNIKYLAAAALCVAGTAVIVFRQLHSHDLQTGFLLLQISNLSFAGGQVIYKRWMKQRVAANVKDIHLFGWLYAGAVIFTGTAAAFAGKWNFQAIDGGMLLTLLYLGTISSGLCFFLWNVGAKRVNTGSLAIMNNIKIPLAIFLSITLFGESGNILRLGMGGLIVLASLWLTEKRFHKPQRTIRLNI